MRNVRIAMLQMPVMPGQQERNLQTAKRMLVAACQKGCDIAILPECCDFGWTDASALTAPEGRSAGFLADAARELGIHVVAGIVEKENGRLYNTAVMFSDKGERLGSHRKIHLVGDVEDDFYTAGTEIRVFDTACGRVGLPICADTATKSLFVVESMAYMGAQLLLSPCSWAVPPEELGQPYGECWYAPYLALTAKYNVTIAGVSNVGPVNDGPWKGYLCIGNSIAAGEGGKIMAALPYGADAEAIHILECSID